MTIDAAGEINLDADSGGTVRLMDASVNYGTLYSSSSDFVILSQAQDKDIILQGNDGGSTINALTLDMSDAGTATFNHDIKLGPSGGDVFLYYNGAKWLSTPSNAKYLSLGDSGSNPWEGNTGTRLMFGSADTSAIDGYYIGTNLENYGGNGNYNKLDIDYGTGIRLKANRTYGGTRFYDSTNDALLLSVGAGNTDVEVANNLIIPSNLQHAGDDDTMLQFSDANTIRLVAGNTETFKTTASAITMSVPATINSGVTIDEITIDGDTITATDDFIIDAAADIKLDANGGYINFFDNGTAILSFANSSTDAVIWSRASDRDMIFKGNDGGSTITALTLDMSEAGAATFNAGITVGGDVNSTSDINLKENVQTVENAYDKVSNLRGVNFNWKDSGKYSMGVIAQEVEEIIPEVVLTNEEGTKSVNYQAMVGVLIEAVKTLQAKVEDLENGSKD